MDSSSNIPGYHTSFTMPRQTVDPTTGSTQIALYNKFDASNVPQLFFRPNNNQTPIQLTNDNLSFVQNSTVGDRQSTFLAGPFTIYQGFIINATDNQVVTLTPASTLEFVNLIALTKSANGAVPVSLTANQFTIRLGGGAQPRTIYYYAIGLT